MRKEHLVTDSDCIPVRCLNHSRLLLNGPQGQDSHLRLHDDRCPHDISKSANIGDCKRPASQVVGFEFILSCPPCEVVDNLGQPVKAVLIGLPDYRHNKISAGERYGHTNIDLFLLDDPVAVDLDIDHWKVLDG